MKDQLWFYLSCTGLAIVLPRQNFQRENLLDLFFDEYYEDDHLDAYERLLLDAIERKSSLFMRRDEVEESWLFIDKLIEAIQVSDLDLEKYNAGSWGPSSSDLLIANHGSKWNNDE